jgi:hypothetical protein
LISYYGYTLSPNQIETGEGFLICRNVPIARTGDQDYLESEIIEGGDATKVVKVHRPESEVFADAALASFEGKPFTNDHPPVLLDPENALSYEKGHAQNVRRGSGEWDGYMIADLHVHDADTIEAIKGGKRQISCGYECEYTDNGDGTYTQSKIRGNHVALVDLGRAGAKAAIMDSNKAQAAETAGKDRKMTKTEKFLHLFGLAANGKSAEEVSKLAMDTAEALAEETGKDPVELGKDAEAPKAEDACKDADPMMAEVSAKLDKLIELLTPKAEPEKDSDPIEQAIKEMAGQAAEATTPEEDESLAEQEEAHVVPAEEMTDGAEPEKAAPMDSKAVLMAMRTAIAGISDEAQRKAVTDALLGAVVGKKEKKVTDAQKIAQTVAKNAQKAPKMDTDAIQAAYDSMNPHKAKKED